MLLDRDAAEASVAPITARLNMSQEEAAFAIYDIVNEGMADALNERCTKRGFDPREFLLIAGGGAGGLHVVEIARKAGLKQVMIPKFASAYCAFGMQLPDFSQDYVRTYPKRLADADLGIINALYAEMEEEGTQVLLRSGARRDQLRFARSADLRYVGQFNEVEVDTPAEPMTASGIEQLATAFHRKHEQTFAFSMQDRHVEVVYLRLRAMAATPPVHLKKIEQGSEAAEAARKPDRRCYFGRGGGWRMTPVYDGSGLTGGNRIAGPALIEEAGSTIMVPDAARAEVDLYGNYLIQVS
jgi:N-methylhydantoinase A